MLLFIFEEFEAIEILLHISHELGGVQEKSFGFYEHHNFLFQIIYHFFAKKGIFVPQAWVNIDHREDHPLHPLELHLLLVLYLQYFPLF